jgi:Toprim-like
MDVANIQTLLRKLGCSKIKPSGRWVYSSCPLAAHTHAKGRDNHPSFSVAVSPGGVSGCRCHACSFSGSLLELMWRLERASGSSASDALEFVRIHNQPNSEAATKAASYAEVQKVRLRAISCSTPASGVPVAFPAYKVGAVGDVAGMTGVQLALLPDDVKLPVLDDSVLEAYRKVPASVRSYLMETRGYEAQTLRKWEIGWDRAEQRIVIPVRDCKKRLVGVSRRAFVDGQRPKYRHSTGFRRDYYLYGECFLEENVEATGYLVEGFFDVLRLRRRGYRGVAMMGSHLSEFQMEKLVHFFTNLVIVPDGDAPGAEAAAKAYASMRHRLPTSVVPIPEGKDPDDLTAAEMQDLLGEPDPTIS